MGWRRALSPLFPYTPLFRSVAIVLAGRPAEGDGVLNVVLRRGGRVRPGPRGPGGATFVAWRPRVDVLGRLLPAASAVAVVLSHLPRPRPDQTTCRWVVPALDLPREPPSS